MRRTLYFAWLFALMLLAILAADLASPWRTRRTLSVPENPQTAGSAESHFAQRLRAAIR